MKAAVFHGQYRISLDEVPDPVIESPTDAIVDIEYAGVCGSDLWTYRGEGFPAPHRIGHEFVGVVSRIGSDVHDVAVGDWVIVPFRFSDGTCHFCKAGLETSCIHGGFWGRGGTDGGQGEHARVPFADGTLVKALPDGGRPAESDIPGLLALTDVFTTGYHAAVSAGVRTGSTVIVVGDGAVGLSAIAAAKLLGAARVINAGSRHADRNALARAFGADDTVDSRGEDAVRAIAALTGGTMADVVIECVGSAQSFETAVRLCSPGGTVGYVGLPHGVALDMATLFPRNITIAGGISPAHHYMRSLIPAVLEHTIDPGRVFTRTYGLDGIAQAYADMDARTVIKPLIKVSHGR